MNTQKIYTFAALLPLAIGISACGKISGALDEMSSMNTSTAAMNNKMDKTNDGMNETNSGMKKTLGAISETNAMMGKTNKAIHNQTLGVSFDDLLKPEYTKYVSLDSVTPTSMMVPGKIFAEEATQEEIASLTYTFLLEINVAQPDPTLEVVPANAKPGTQADYTDAEKSQVDLDKWIKFTALQVLAGLAPQETIDDMIQKQIVEGGRYEDAAYSVLMLRHLFVQSYLLDATLMTEKFDNPGKFDDALKYVGYLKKIEKQPFSKSVEVQMSGYFDVPRLNPDTNKVEKRGLNKTWNLGKADVSKDYYPLLKSALNQLKSEFKDSDAVAKIKQEIADGIAGN